jgi:hypothetical protein
MISTPALDSPAWYFQDSRTGSHAVGVNQREGVVLLFDCVIPPAFTEVKELVSRFLIPEVM